MTTQLAFTNWKHIYKSLSDIHTIVEQAERGYTPKASLTEAVMRLNQLKADMSTKTSYKRKDRQVSNFTTHTTEDSIKVNPSYKKVEGATIDKVSIPNIGAFNTVRQFIIITNLIESIKYTLNEKEKNVKQLAPVFSKVKDAIKTLAQEVVSTVDNTIISNYVENSLVESSKVNEEELAELPQPMQEMAKNIAKLQRNENEDKSTTRDIVSISQVVQNNNRDLAAMEKHIKNAMLGQADETFTVVRGPVITDSKLDIKKLNDSNVIYDTVFYPGAKRAIGSSIGSSAKEPTPRMFIIRDQLLIAIMLDSEKRFQLKLNKTPFEKKVKKSDEEFARLRGDIVDVLSQKLSYSLVDITAQRNPPYFTSPKFPRIRFVWIIRKSTYDRLGNFHVGTKTSLPF